MHHGIRAGPGGQIARQAKGQFWVKQRQRWFQLRMVDAEFHAFTRMGDHRRTFSFGASSGRGRNGDQRWKRLIRANICRLGFPFKLPKIPVISGGKADGLASIHRTAASNRNDRIVIARAEFIAPGANFIIARVWRYFRKQASGHACVRQNPLQP